MAATAAEGATTARLVLRPLRAADAPALAADWEVARHTQRIPHPYPEGAAEAFIAQVAADRAAGHADVFAITRRDDGLFLGNIGLEQGDRPGEVEVGYWLGRPFWGAGYATEAVKAAVRHAFGFPDVRTVFAEIHPDNVASRRVLEKAEYERVRAEFKKIKLDLPEAVEPTTTERFFAGDDE